jgi:murein DD-endopeptidase MepM/ murein hydrolase activator NlpD
VGRGAALGIVLALAGCGEAEPGGPDDAAGGSSSSASTSTSASNTSSASTSASAATGGGEGGAGAGGAPAGGGFGYPVGDLTTWPAGGWTVTQVLGHYLNWNGFEGGHLAQDVAADEATTANAPVHAIGDGEVLYAGSNTSSYVNVVLIRHELAGGEIVCSFYGHLGSVAVSEGQFVLRGEPIATILDWNAQFGYPNSHLHYVVLGADLCAASDAAGGALVCGYDDTAGPNGITELSNEPAVYTSVGDPCGDHNYPDAFRSPSQFIEALHF